MVKLPGSLKIKRRYILVENLDKNRLKIDYIKFFGYIDFLDSNIKIWKISDFFVISTNRKKLHKVLFVLYLQNSKIIKVFKTIKSIKQFLNIS
ncbi:MAG: hypothetical protein ACP5G1_01640 [Nanopusillaceae archaeon]